MIMSATKAIPIERPAAGSYAILADPGTMPQRARHNVKDIGELNGDRWERETPIRKAPLIPHYEERDGFLDNEFIGGGEGVWRVTGRVVPLGLSESVYIITLPKPESMPAEAFEAGMRLMDEELAALKACIESM